MPKKNNRKNLTLKYRGLGLEPDILKNLERIALKENRKINPLINMLLKEALASRKAA